MRVHGKRVRARGFSLVEAMVSAGVLGVLMTGLLGMYDRSLRGIRSSEHLNAAMELSAQVGDLLSTSPPEALPACAGVAGCVAGGVLQPALAPAGAYACTRWADAQTVPQGGTQTYAAGRIYRVDTVVGAHPDAARYPSARLLTVSVCWTEDGGRPHQVQTRRLLVPGA